MVTQEARSLIEEVATSGEPLFCESCGRTLLLHRQLNGSVVGICQACHQEATGSPDQMAGTDCPGCLVCWSLWDLEAIVPPGVNRHP